MAGWGFAVIQRPPGVEFVDRQVRVELARRLLPVMQKGLQQYQGVISTWSQESRPDFILEFAKHRGGFVTTIKKSDHPAEKAQLSVWDLLTDGTKIRYAKMSEDFIPKTAVRSLRSGPGRGKLDKIDTTEPKPGIDDRLWEDTINPRLFADVVEAVVAAYDAAATSRLPG